MGDGEQDKYDEWLDAVQSDGVNLSAWESDFIASLVTQREAGRDLSDKQANILERIYSERTP